jgi:hypothetical protein
MELAAVPSRREEADIDLVDERGDLRDRLAAGCGGHDGFLERGIG